MHAGLQSGGRLIDCVTATVVALVLAVVAQRVVLPAPSIMCADPSPGSAVPAQFYWHCPMCAGAISIPSIDALVPATLAKWLRLPAPVHTLQFPQDVPAVASTG